MTTDALELGSLEVVKESLLGMQEVDYQILSVGSLVVRARSSGTPVSSKHRSATYGTV